ncbi:hypothetical protein, partial [Herbidospora sp. RD11066]
MFAEKIQCIRQEMREMEQMVEDSMDDVEAVEHKKVTDRYREVTQEEHADEPKPEPDPDEPEPEDEE